MQKIIYYVAASLDGFIAGPGDNVSGFQFQGSGVDQFLSDLQAFQTVIMGRKTYEFGYAFGLQPGQPAYPGMQHFIFSNSLEFEAPDSTVAVKKCEAAEIEKIKQQSPTDIFLCGGGQFAGWLLENGWVDQLKIKLNPISLGTGTKLFGESTAQQKWQLAGCETFAEGMVILTYDYLGK